MSTPSPETPTPERIIKYGDRTFPDPGPQFSNEEILANLKSVFPELSNANISEKDLPDGKKEILFEKVAGTKG